MDDYTANSTAATLINCLVQPIIGCDTLCTVHLSSSIAPLFSLYSCIQQLFKLTALSQWNCATVWFLYKVYDSICICMKALLWIPLVLEFLGVATLVLLASADMTLSSIYSYCASWQQNNTQTNLSLRTPLHLADAVRLHLRKWVLSAEWGATTLIITHRADGTAHTDPDPSFFNFVSFQNEIRTAIPKLPVWMMKHVKQLEIHISYNTLTIQNSFVLFGNIKNSTQKSSFFHVTRTALHLADGIQSTFAQVIAVLATQTKCITCDIVQPTAECMCRSRCLALLLEVHVNTCYGVQVHPKTKMKWSNVNSICGLAFE